MAQLPLVSPFAMTVQPQQQKWVTIFSNYLVNVNLRKNHEATSMGNTEMTVEFRSNMDEDVRRTDATYSDSSPRATDRKGKKHGHV